MIEVLEQISAGCVNVVGLIIMASENKSRFPSPRKP